MDSVALVSGGLDSITMLYKLVRQDHRLPVVLTFDYGQKNIHETQFAQFHARVLGLRYSTVGLDLPGPVEHEEGYIPARNLVFASIAASLAEGRGLSQIFMGFHDFPEAFWDASRAFVSKMNFLFEENKTRSIQLVAPLMEYRRVDIMRLGLELGIDYSKTWSCFDEGPKACGVCPACENRLKNFKLIGVKDPLEYEVA